MTLANPKSLLPVSRKAIRRSRSLYFRLDDAKQLVKECEENDLAVIGIEGLTLDEKGITPHLDLIADHTALAVDWGGYSWDRFRSKCNASALNFLEMAEKTADKTNLVFDFALMQSPEFDEFQRRHAIGRASRGQRLNRSKRTIRGAG